MKHIVSEDISLLLIADMRCDTKKCQQETPLGLLDDVLGAKHSRCRPTCCTRDFQHTLGTAAQNTRRCTAYAYHRKVTYTQARNATLADWYETWEEQRSTISKRSHSKKIQSWKKKYEITSQHHGQLVASAPGQMKWIIDRRWRYHPRIQLLGNLSTNEAPEEWN